MKSDRTGRPGDRRVAKREDLGVEVSRDLTGSGRILRGRTTGAHTITFKSTGHRTGGRDPVFVKREERPATGVAGGEELQEREVPVPESAGKQSLFRRLKFWR